MLLRMLPVRQAITGIFMYLIIQLNLLTRMVIVHGVFHFSWSFLSVVQFMQVCMEHAPERYLELLFCLTNAIIASIAPSTFFEGILAYGAAGFLSGAAWGQITGQNAIQAGLQQGWQTALVGGIKSGIIAEKTGHNFFTGKDKISIAFKPDKAINNLGDNRVDRADFKDFIYRNFKERIAQLTHPLKGIEAVDN
jgi:hypothetical protein